MNEQKDTVDADQNENQSHVKTEEEHERERVFQISANRGRSRHKLRYVESSVSDTGDCRLCVGALSPEQEENDKS
ncbi:hypothetical protein CWI82_07100 [Pseudidiomarina tainanensis]|jgi:hypothetical protein|uniref:Uncharacterized protein n=2 Tax=Pseudidiomarina TaxID=2800384 RepID=A0A1I6G8T3_9GAMM|nr:MULTISPECIES: hypothetical protein [Pseudidiomarina]RZQ57030.1 hypothetical protein CWI82_07100 [Pseudidiomarina tainanensis]SFR38560.1 hypothetical protein SAMN04488070_0303 [Pseudidiomarina maritima]